MIKRRSIHIFVLAMAGFLFVLQITYHTDDIWAVKHFLFTLLTLIHSTAPFGNIKLALMNSHKKKHNTSCKELFYLYSSRALDCKHIRDVGQLLEM